MTILLRIYHLLSFFFFLPFSIFQNIETDAHLRSVFLIHPKELETRIIYNIHTNTRVHLILYASRTSLPFLWPKKNQKNHKSWKNKKINFAKLVYNSPA